MVRALYLSLVGLCCLRANLNAQKDSVFIPKIGRNVKVPGNILGLSKLKSLSLGKNPLEPGILGDLCQLISLNYLNLDGQVHLEFPASLKCMTALKKLEIRGKHEGPLKGLHFLRHLEYLDVVVNNYDDLSKEVFKLKKLKHLKLSAKQLDSLSNNIGQLSNLETLYLFP